MALTALHADTHMGNGPVCLVHIYIYIYINNRKKRKDEIRETGSNIYIYIERERGGAKERPNLQVLSVLLSLCK